MVHFWARFRIFPRPSKPSASHAGWAARARATAARTSSEVDWATVAMTPPVAGLTTSRPPPLAPLVLTLPFVATESAVWVSDIRDSPKRFADGQSGIVVRSALS